MTEKTRPYISVLAGATGGLVGCLAMNVVSTAWAVRRDARAPEAASQQGTRPDVAMAQTRAADPDLELATSKVAAGLEETVLSRPLSRRERLEHGKAVHLAYGTIMGAAYGYAMRNTRSGPAGDAAFGLLLWAGGILIALPALKLIRSPGAYTLQEHALGVLGHLAYGTTLGAAYRLLNGGSASTAGMSNAA